MARSSSRQRLPGSIQSGMWAGGDAAMIPEGYVRKLRNVIWGDVWISRPPFTSDGLVTIRGLGIWFDESTGKRRLIAIKEIGSGLGEGYVKSSTDEAWSSRIDGALISADDIHDWVNFRGRFYYIHRGSSSYGLRRYTGTDEDSVKLDGYDNSSIQPQCVCVFADRLILGGVKFSIRNFLYDLDAVVNYTYNPSNWTRVNVTAGTFTSTGGTTYTITPTNTTTASVEAPLSFLVLDGGTNNSLIARWRADLRSRHESYDIPLTMQLRHSQPWAASELVAAGQIYIPTVRNNLRYRAQNAGTAGAGEPVWPTTVGLTVGDNGITWICEGTDVAGETSFFLESLGKNSQFSTYQCVARIADGLRTALRPLLKFGTSTTATYTLASVEFAFVDARSDGAPYKQNFGHQITKGEFEFPFLNIDNGSNATVSATDTWMWTDPGTEIVRAQNSYKMREEPGDVVAVRPLTRDRLVVSKRNSATIFTPTQDANVPFLPELGFSPGIGILNPKAADVATHDGATYAVGEDGVYRWNVGSEPKELCGERMLREMFSKSTATWVESQAAPANRALLTIDQKNKAVYVYVQKGLIHRYDIRGDSWSVIEAGGDTSSTARGYQICDMLYNPGTSFVYFAYAESASGTAGLARLDDTQAAAEDSISSSGTLPVHHEIIFRPIEGRPRVDMAVDELHVHADCTVANQTATAFYSKDQGSTFTASSTPRSLSTATANFEPERFGIWQSWGTITPRLLVTGKAGPGAFKLSGVEVAVRAQKKPEFPKKSP